MLLEDYTELSNYIDALIKQELDAPVEEETDMNGYFSWAMIGEALDSIGETSQDPDSAAPENDAQLPVAASVSSVDALLCIANSAASILQQGKVNDPTVAEMVADMMRDTADKIEKDPVMKITGREQILMVLWLQRYADKLMQLPHSVSAMNSPQGLWNNIQYKVRQFHDMLT